jgi:hypothetical protein
MSCGPERGKPWNNNVCNCSPNGHAPNKQDDAGRDLSFVCPPVPDYGPGPVQGIGARFVMKDNRLSQSLSADIFCQ